MQEKITFLIASYENLPLLKKCFENVLTEAKNGDQIIISEDGVDKNDNLNYFINKYQLWKIESDNQKIDCWFGKIEYSGKKFELLFLQRKTNGRFALNVNEAVSWVKNNYFLLLNNDVFLLAGARDKLLAEFKNKKVFAVTAREIDQQTKKISGKNKIWWHKGRFWHARDDNWQKNGDTAWACGGSSLFKTNIWRELKGFDLSYYPAYWEDIDLSWRAKKAGYQVKYVAEAVVNHCHETTNNEVFGQKKMQEMSWRGGNIFAWKNSNWQQKIQFLLFYPWWQIKQFPAFRWWWVVILVALLSRVAFINTVPNGLTVDEAAIAYNGYAIFTQRRDEWLNFLPVSFRSYGDYKAPLAIYINGLVTGLLGLEIWAIRVPFVLAGLASIYLMMLIIYEWLKEWHEKAREYAAIIGLVMAFLPWSFHYGRLGFENNFALMFILAGIYCLLKELKSINVAGQKFWHKWWSKKLFLSSLFFALSLYSYHSAKVFLPLLLVWILIYYRKVLWQKKKQILLPLLFGLLILTPLLKDSLWGEGLTRAGSSYLFDGNISFSDKIKLLGEGYAAHFNYKYLLGGQLNTSNNVKQQIEYPNYRHGDGYDGIINYLLVILIGMALMSWLQKTQKLKYEKELWRWSLVLIFLGVLPAAMTKQVPHSNQAILALPGFLGLGVLGLVNWQKIWKKNQEFYDSFLWLLVILVTVFFLHYQKMYYQIFANETRLTANYQNEKKHEAISFLFAQNLLTALKDVRVLEKEVEQVIVASGMEHEYIYALLARGTKPISYQHGSLSEKYLFVDRINATDFDKKQTLILSSPANLPSEIKNDLIINEYKNNSGKTNLVLFWIK